MSATTMHQSRVPKVHLPSDSSYPAGNARTNSRYKSTLHVETSTRDYSTRNRRPPTNTGNLPPNSYNNISYRSQTNSTGGQSSSRSYQENSSSQNRRSSVITLTTRPTSFNGQVDLLAIEGKRYSNDSTRISNHSVAVTQPNNVDRTHFSCPVAYQNQTNLATSTVLSDCSSDNTILHHLPDHSETTDKSQQSLHDERLHRSPRKGNHQLVTTRIRSGSLIDDQRKYPTPSIQYNIEPIEIHEEFHDENQHDSRQKAVREEKKRKANENEQVLINVDEYAPEILIYLREREFKCRPKPHYMKKQTELTWDMRAILIDWLSEVADEYKLYSESLHLAVNFIDRFLSRMSVTKSKFQLIGTTALYLAAKCEEVYPPNAAEFAYVTDNAYTKKQVLKIEDLLLQTLHFEVSTVTTHTFLLHYLKLAEVDEVTEDLARYIAELTLLESECLEYLSSLQAAAILCLSLHMCRKPAWSQKLKQTTGYTIQSFYSIMEKIFWLVAKANVNDKWAITRKYRHVKHHCVASIELPTTLPYVDMNSDAVV